MSNTEIQLIAAICGISICFAYSIIIEIIENIKLYIKAKKCNYNCDKCKAICEYKYCKRKREKLNEKK